jgi:hypothetical protein
MIIIYLCMITNDSLCARVVSAVSQVQLLNSTVASLALFINRVLTQSYRAIYGNDDEAELILVVAPISATGEVKDLFEKGIIDFETAIPTALHSLGCSAEEIAAALDRRRTTENEAKAMNNEREQTEKDELKARSKVAKQPEWAAGLGNKPAAAAGKSTSSSSSSSSSSSNNTNNKPSSPSASK